MNRSRWEGECFKHKGRYCIDNSQEIPERVWKRLRKITLGKDIKKNWICGVDFAKGRGMAVYLSNKKGVVCVEKVVVL